MEFLLYLTPEGHQLIRNIISAKFHVHENTQFCRQNSNVFGYTDSPFFSRKFVICTENIKKFGNTKFYVNETVFHETVHAAQICNKDEPLGLSIRKNSLSAAKLQDVITSSMLTKSYKVEQKEKEAFYLEDKPKQVSYYLKKFCF